MVVRILAENLSDLLITWRQLAYVDVYDWSLYTGANGIDIQNSEFDLLRQALI
jgi:hypothetical protein